MAAEAHLSETTYLEPTTGQRHAFPTLFSEPSIELSVVVPAYNEALRLPQMLDEALGYLSDRHERTRVFTYEIIIVDDGSSDSTAEVALTYVKKFSSNNVRLLRLVRNSGKGAAVRRGMLSTRGRYILMADADAATVFSDVERLEIAVANGADVAIGSRTHLKGRGDKEGRGLLRGFISTVFNFVVVYIGGVTGLRDTQCGFKLYSRSAARVAFEGQKLDRWAFDVENLYRVQKVGMTVVEVPVQWTEVPGSKLSVVKATLNMLKDMLRMRIKYTAGAWALPAASVAQ